MKKGLTNGDMIRKLSDEQLADILTDYDYIDFCRNMPECMEKLTTNQDITKAECKQCAMDWLRSEVE